MRILIGISLLLFLCSCQSIKITGTEKLPVRVEEITPEKVVLTSPGNRVVLRSDSAVAMINGTPVQLGETITFADMVWSVPEKASGVLLAVLTAKPRRIVTVLIDPGHGGHDDGAVSVAGAKEKDLNLALSLEIGRALQRRGCKVYLTRNRDKYLTLDERPAMIKRVNADLFISVHHNSSASNPDAAGMETFVFNSADPAEQKKRDESLRGALLIQNHQAQLNYAPDRGVKSARFKVLRLASCPAVLIEAGFLSNAAEAKRCATGEFQRKLAGAVADAVVQFAAGN